MSTLLLPRLIRLILPALFLLAVGCSHDEIIGPFDDPDLSEGKVVLTFTATTPLATRTQMAGSDNLQHVEKVQLYIFNGRGDNALCVASEDVGWKYENGVNDGLSSREQTYTVLYEGFLPESEYTFLAVGRDNTSSSTYDFPASIVVGTTTLRNAKATLATGKDKNNIAVSELFAGSSILTTTILGSGRGRVDLYRRVAGVMGWFINIPTQIGGMNVASLRIELYKAQNKSVPLIVQIPDVIMEPIAETDENKILVEIPAKDFIKDGITAKGSYVLPIIAPFETLEAATAAGYSDNIYVKDYTLRIILVNASGYPLRTQKIINSSIGDSATSGGTGIIITADAYRFPILANNFYGIGTANKPVDMGGGGDEIVITVNPNWDTIIDRPMVP